MAQTVNVRLSVLMHDELVTASELLHAADAALGNKDSTKEQKTAAIQQAMHAAMVALFECHKATHIVVLKTERLVPVPGGAS